MDWLTPFLPTLIDAAIYAIVPSLIAYLITVVPGPVKNWLQSATHDRRMALLVGAMRRAAQDLLPQLLSGQMTRAQAVAVIFAYVRQNLPSVLVQLGAVDAALKTMASAAVTEVVTPTPATREAAQLVASAKELLRK